MSNVSPSNKPWLCTKCKRCFADIGGLRSHCKKKHKGAGMSKSAKMAWAERHEESFADRARQAEIDHAMGIHNHDYRWLVEPYKEDSSWL